MVLAAPSDPSSPWLCDGLLRRGVEGVRSVSVDALVYSTSLTHRITRTGTAHTEIVLHDGSTIGPDLEWTVNRAQFLPTLHLDSATALDRDYATQELYALFTSVLFGMRGRMANRAGPRGLSGPYLAGSEWARTAGAAGLTVTPYRSTERPQASARQPVSVFVVGEEVVPSVNASSTPPNSVVDGCRRLAALLGVELLAAEFIVNGETWEMTGGSCTPDLRPGGENLLDAFARMLQ